MTKNQAKRKAASRAGAKGSGPAARSAWKVRYRKVMETLTYPRKAKGETVNPVEVRNGDSGVVRE